MLNVINPKDGTDYWIGGLDADKDKGMQWMTGILSQCARTDLNKRFLPKPMTATG